MSSALSSDLWVWTQSSPSAACSRIWVLSDPSPFPSPTCLLSFLPAEDRRFPQPGVGFHGLEGSSLVCLLGLEFWGQSKVTLWPRYSPEQQSLYLTVRLQYLWSTCWERTLCPVYVRWCWCSVGPGRPLCVETFQVNQKNINIRKKLSMWTWYFLGNTNTILAQNLKLKRLFIWLSTFKESKRTLLFRRSVMPRKQEAVCRRSDLREWSHVFFAMLDFLKVALEAWVCLKHQKRPFLGLLSLHVGNETC